MLLYLNSGKLPRALMQKVICAKESELLDVILNTL
jgi:hypothetical protein